MVKEFDYKFEQTEFKSEMKTLDIKGLSSPSRLLRSMRRINAKRCQPVLTLKYAMKSVVNDAEDGYQFNWQFNRQMKITQHITCF